MVSEPTEAVILDESFLTSLSKLLLNSWSAEYALRITPMVRDEEYLKNALNWTFPQAYYSALFGARAVLLCQGTRFSSEEFITVAMDALAESGLYEADCLVRNAYAELLPYRIGSTQAVRIPDGMDLATFHADLIKKVVCLSTAHERFILEHIGAFNFKQLVEHMPVYLRCEFVDRRCATLTTQGHAAA